MEIPILSSDLIEMLDRLIPERCPRAVDSERDIWIYVGKRELVRKLVTQLAEIDVVEEGVQPLKRKGGDNQNGNTSSTDQSGYGNRLDD